MYKERAIIFTGYAASAAAYEILLQRKEELDKRYPCYYLKKAEKELYVSGSEEEEAVPEAVDTEPGGYFDGYFVNCGRDGVFGALWRLGEQLECGLSVELSAIPVRQAAIELCDLADISPYESDSRGCSLIVSENPGKKLKELQSEGINAVIIGYTNDSNAKTVNNGEIVRFLNRT